MACCPGLLAQPHSGASDGPACYQLLHVDMPTTGCTCQPPHAAILGFAANCICMKHTFHAVHTAAMTLGLVHATIANACLTAAATHNARPTCLPPQQSSCLTAGAADQRAQTRGSCCCLHTFVTEPSPAYIHIAMQVHRWCEQRASRTTPHHRAPQGALHVRTAIARKGLHTNSDKSVRFQCVTSAVEACAQATAILSLLPKPECAPCPIVCRDTLTDCTAPPLLASLGARMHSIPLLQQAG